MLIDLKMLDETITFYENLLSKELPDQFECYQGIIDDLFDNWQGTHADTYHAKFVSLLYGPGPGSFVEGEVASLRAVQERTEKIVDCLKEGKEVFQAEMGRCEDLFYYGLTCSESICFTNSTSNTAYDGKLFIDYDKAEDISIKLQSLIENECNFVDAPENSQMGKWNKVLEAFENSLKHSGYHPGNSDFRIRGILTEEFTRIQNFWYSIGMYKKNLEEIEEALAAAFGEQTSDYAKGMTRQIYEVSAAGEINIQRIRYLSQKNPDSYTPAEMDEIHKILVYTMEEAPKQDVNDFILLNQQTLTQNMLNAGVEKMALDKLFRGYSTALNTTYAKDVSRMGDMDRLSEYFYKDTLQRLTTTDGGLDSGQLNCIMELNPDSLTAGDYKALSVVFDGQVSGTDMESMNRANLFLANCYINAEVIPSSKVDAERSMVFDKWAEYYLGQEVNKTTLTDFEILSNTEMDGNYEVNTKFLKQALLQIASSNAALKLQINGGFSPEDSETWNPQMGLFEIGDLMTGRRGDYRLTIYQNYKESGEKIEIEYFEYRNSSGMSTLLQKGVVDAYGEFNKSFLDYTKENAQDFVIDKITGGLVDGAKGVAVAITDSNVVGLTIDGAVEAGKFGIGWFAQDGKNREIAENMSKYYDGREMEAYQQSGQVMYVNGIKIINNLNVDEDYVDFLQNKFKEQIENSENYEEFLLQADSEEEREAIKRGLHDTGSAEYKNAFINWYLEGIGDNGQTLGKEYKIGD